MVSVAKHVVARGEDCNYLDHATFQKNRHDEKVQEIFNEKVPGYTCPAARPTRSHTFNFNLTYRGARLIDSECKDTATLADEGVLVLHTADQFACKYSSLSMLTTSNGIKFLSSVKDSGAGAMRMTFFETHRYKLGPITCDSFQIDPHAKDVDLQMPPKFHMTRNGKIYGVHEKDEECEEYWNDLRSECKWFIIVALQAIDVICSEVMCMEVKQVAVRRTRTYHAGWGKPSFLSSGILELKSKRPIQDEWRFMYSRHTMEGPDYKNDDLRLHAQFLSTYKEVLNSNLELSDEFRRMAKRHLQKHKNKLDEAAMEAYSVNK